MEVKIGVQDSPREIALESTDTQEAVVAAVQKVMNR